MASNELNFPTAIDRDTNADITIESASADSSKEYYVVLYSDSSPVIEKSSVNSSELTVNDGVGFVMHLTTAEIQRVNPNALSYELYEMTDGEPESIFYGTINVEAEPAGTPKPVVQERSLYVINDEPDTSNFKEGDVVYHDRGDLLLMKPESKAHVMHFEHQLFDRTAVITKGNVCALIAGITENEEAKLPPAADWKNQHILIINNDPAYSVDVIADGSETINGSNTPIVLDTQYSKCLLFSIGTEIIRII